MVSDLITVSVTAEDLACGWEYMISPAPTEPDRRACDKCPIEHALTRAVGQQVLMNNDEAWLAWRSYARVYPVPCVTFPTDVQVKIKQIDKGLPVKPFTFEIERPK